MLLINETKHTKTDQIEVNDFIFGTPEGMKGTVCGFVAGFAYRESVLGANGNPILAGRNIIGFLIAPWPLVFGRDGRPLNFVIVKKNVLAAYRLAGPLEQMIDLYKDEAHDLVGVALGKIPLPVEQKEVLQ